MTPKITEEAADWLIRLDEDAGPETRAEFFAWVQQSAHHVKEFLCVTEAFRELDGMDPQRHIDVAGLLADNNSNVVQLQETATAQAAAKLNQAPAKARRRPWVAAAAALAIALFGWYWLQPPGNDPLTFTTSVGEQRSFKLADGSVVHLNARSRVQVDYSAQERHIRLLEGEALFVVAREPARPFRVATGLATVQALGTQFNVYKHGDNITVSVVEGSVRVSAEHGQKVSAQGISPPSDGSTQTLKAGEEVKVVDSGRIEKSAVHDVNKAVAWRQRRLVFQDSRLADVAEEFNRYNTVQIRVLDADARDKQLIGVFNADDPESLVLFLERDRSLLMERDGGDLVIRSR